LMPLEEPVGYSEWRVSSDEWEDQWSVNRYRWRGNRFRVSGVRWIPEIRNAHFKIRNLL